MEVHALLDRINSTETELQCKSFTAELKIALNGCDVWEGADWTGLEMLKDKHACGNK